MSAAAEQVRVASGAAIAIAKVDVTYGVGGAEPVTALSGIDLDVLDGAFVPDDGGQPYREFWGETREQERAAFERFVDWLVEHRARYPQAHVYHYAAYEKTAVRRLAGRGDL